MIFRFKCDRCGKDMRSGIDRLKVISLTSYRDEKKWMKYKTIHEGDLCIECWEGIKKNGSKKI